MQEKEWWYITTAIHYTNGKPHIGHAFEFLIADVLARWKSLNEYKVHFLTGTDEHGQKIERTANSLRIPPKKLCDQNSEVFKDLCRSLKVQYSLFLRTTDEYHREQVYEFFKKCRKNSESAQGDSDLSDIYKGEYVGWYNVREETFVSDHDAKVNNYKDPVSGESLSQMKEPSYFFRLSKYQDRVLKFLKENPNFIVPAHRQNEIIRRLESDKLQDLSISRMSTKWGIPVPDDPDHVLYVWFDALVNYISGASQLNYQNNGWKGHPADTHVIGKDILWFHSTIWLSMLMSADLPFPKQIFVHGFVCDSNGQKMSKSVGNVVDPNYLIGRYPLDAIRYYLIQDFNPDGDFNFNEETLKRHHDSNLLGNLGNFVNRTFGLFHKYSKGIVPGVPVTVLFDLKKIIGELDNLMANFKLQLYCDKVFALLTQLNTYINETRIWEICNEKYPEDQRTEQHRQEVIRALWESMNFIAHFLHPIIPDSAAKLLKYMDEPLMSLDNLGWGMIYASKEIKKQDTKLFSILDTEAAEKRKQKNVKKVEKMKK